MKLQNIIVLALILLIFHPWFFSGGTLTSGDWPYLFPESIKEFSFFPEARFLWLAPYYQIPTKVLVEYLRVPWEVTERILWFFPFLVLSIISSYYLTRSWIGVLIYTTNTYILMVVGGGQMGIALAYSLAPLVLGRFVKLINLLNSSDSNMKYQISNIKYLIASGLLLAIQLMFDPRIAYITMLGIFPYCLLHFRLKTAMYLSIPVATGLLLNLYWIISLAIHGVPSEVLGYTAMGGFQFLSFADFSHAISLLHPNWPENIFGKTYFMQPEFLVLPILAYSSLLFLRNSKLKTQSSKLQLKSQNFNNNLAIKQFNDRTIVFFALVGLIGALLAKGVNPPFGEINTFLFQYFPGMSIFRDPTKFYILVALSYSILIPFSAYSVQEWLKSKVKTQESKSQLKIQNYLPNLFLLFTILYLIFLIRPAVVGEIGGTLKTHQVPSEYIALKEFLKDRPDFFQILWIPQRQRFGFYSNNHPAVSGHEFFKTSDLRVMTKLLRNKKDIKDHLKKQRIKYIILPYDSEKELFLSDRKYSKNLRRRLKEDLDTTAYLHRNTGFEKIFVFEIE